MQHRATHIKWGLQGLRKPKEHTSEAEFGVDTTLGWGFEKGMRESVPGPRRGYAPRGMEDLAPRIHKPQPRQHIPHAPMTRVDLRKRRTPEQKTDLYLSGELRSFQIPSQVWPAVQLYRQLALQAEMLNEVPKLVEDQMNDLYDAVLAWCEAREAN